MTDYQIKPLKQGHLTKWLIAFDPSGRGDDGYLAVYHGENVKAAASAGIIDGLTPEMVDDLEVMEVERLSGLVLSAVAECRQPPKKKT